MVANLFYTQKIERCKIMIHKVFLSMFYDYTLCIVIGGTAILGLTSGTIGVFAFLRRQSLLGDAISHAALPGIALMFLVTHTKNPTVLLLGGALSGGVGTMLMKLVTYKTTLKTDAILGIVLSVFFGFGLVLLTIIQKLPIANQAILNKFLFGNASTLLPEDVFVMAVVASVVLVMVVVFWKEFTLIAFDPVLAHVLGYPVRLLDMVLIFLLVLTIVIGLQTVGVVLMSTMLIAPAAAARQWTSSCGKMVILAGMFGAVSGALGAIISSMVDRLPTGPTIVVIVSVLVLCSLLFAPHRGILYAKWKRKSIRI